MNEPNRRGFLVLAGAGAAAVGAVAVAPAAEASTSVPNHVREPLVAYVRDARSGEVAVMIGEREVVVHDGELAARIARAAN